MATINITPIPYNGGTIDLTSRRDLTAVHLGAGKIVVLYGQSNPNMIFAHVVNTAGLNSASPTSANGPQFAFVSTASVGSRVRAWRMSPTRLMVLMGTDLRVLELDGSDNITMRAAAAVNFHSVSNLWSPLVGSSNDATYDASGGGTITAIAVSTEAVLFGRRPASGGSFTFNRVVFDPVADTLTISASLMTGFELPTGQNGGSRLRMADVPGSTNKMVYATASYANTTAANRGTYSPRTGYVYLVNDQGMYTRNYNITGKMSGNNNTTDAAGSRQIHFIMPRSESELVGFHDGRSLTFHRGSTPIAVPTSSNISTNRSGEWATGSVTFASTGADSMVTNAIMMDDNHFLITMTAPIPNTESGGAIKSANGTAMVQYFRVGKIIDSNFIMSNDANYTDNELGEPLNIDQDPLLWKIDNTTYAYLTKADATSNNMQIVVRSIYG